METLLSRLESNKNIRTNLFSGIMTVEQELGNSEFSALIDYLGKDCHKVGVIDTQGRSIKSNAFYIMTPSVFEEIGERIFIHQGEVIKAKATLLHVVPDYIVFRELISESNIEEMLRCFMCGYLILAFTSLNKEHLVQLVQNVMNVPEAKQIVEQINII